MTQGAYRGDPGTVAGLLDGALEQSSKTLRIACGTCRDCVCYNLPIAYADDICYCYYIASHHAELCQWHYKSSEQMAESLRTTALTLWPVYWGITTFAPLLLALQESSQLPGCQAVARAVQDANMDTADEETSLADVCHNDSVPADQQVLLGDQQVQSHCGNVSKAGLLISCVHEGRRQEC